MHMNYMDQDCSIFTSWVWDIATKTEEYLNFSRMFGFAEVCKVCNFISLKRYADTVIFVLNQVYKLKTGKTFTKKSFFHPGKCGIESSFYSILCIFLVKTFMLSYLKSMSEISLVFIRLCAIIKVISNLLHKPIFWTTQSLCLCF